MPSQTDGQRHVDISDCLEMLAKAGMARDWRRREDLDYMQDEMYWKKLTRNCKSEIRTAVGSSVQQMGMQRMLCSFNHI